MEESENRDNNGSDQARIILSETPSAIYLFTRWVPA